MKKIKKFKITLRFWGVVHQLKELGIELTPEIKQNIEHKIAEYDNLILPATVYDTFKTDTVSDVLSLIQTPKLSKRSVAASFFISVVGDHTTALFPQKDATNQIGNQIINAVIAEAVEQSANFVYKLLSEEAKKEKCNLGPRTQITDDEAIKKVINLLQSTCIGLNADNYQLVTKSVDITVWTLDKKLKK